MNSNIFHKLRNKCWTHLGRKGGKKGRWEKGVLRSKVDTWELEQEYKEERKFDNIVDNESKS